MAKNKGLLIAVAVVVLAVIIYFSTQQSKVSKTVGSGGEIKMGIILGFTGPIESLTPAMAASAELAFKEASDSGSLIAPPINNSCVGFSPNRKIAANKPVGGIPIVTIGSTLYKGLFFKT